MLVYQVRLVPAVFSGRLKPLALVPPAAAALRKRPRYNIKKLEKKNVSQNVATLPIATVVAVFS